MTSPPESYEEQERRILFESIALEYPVMQQAITLAVSVSLERALERAQRHLAAVRAEAAREEREPRPDPSGVGE